ncbi:MAG: type II secretion system F family protein [Candidatus Woesearchaeota archaeon]|nr:type II secretion system F family protein [Candidatus Woesearchaeota archaeon]
MIKTERRHIIAIAMGVVILAIDIAFFFRSPWFVPLIVVSITLAWSQYWIDFFAEIQRQKNIEARFPDFIRYLSGAIRSGMPVSKAIIHVSKTDFGDLTPYVKKLANQMEWAMPVHKALLIFAHDTGNPVIKRAIATVIEAEQAGGLIEDVLETVTQSVIEIKKIKDKRKANIHSQVIQSYVIFCVFLIIMIIVQNLVVPYVSHLGETAAGEEEITGGILVPLGGMIQEVKFDFSSLSAFISSLGAWFTSLKGVFLMISLIQGFFTGIVIGKLAEGQIYPGLKHSLVLMTIAFFVISLSQAI